VTFELILRIVGMVVLGVVGWQVGEYLGGENATQALRYILVLSLAGAALGLLLTPWVTVRPFLYVRRKIRQLPAQQLVAMMVGLIVGLVAAALLSLPLALLPAPLGSVLPFVGAALLGYAGMAVMSIRQKEIFSIIGLPRGVREAGPRRAEERVVLLDTSVIIDGRIADISRTGFITGTMLVPQFVLNEIQHIADSPDPTRRNRGRRGLDILNRLKEEAVVPVRVTEMDVEEVYEVDSKLVQLAKNLRCPILTNDYNLNRVAQLQGVVVLNINELANAVKTVLLPGETVTVDVIQAGREYGQGLAFLDDGTMIVVEDGQSHIGQTADVTIKKVLQRPEGRLIFAQLAQ
jgi:uncharacterized protein YacL